MEPFGWMNSSPAAEAVDHVHFQISLLRLCAVPDLATSVKPGSPGHLSPVLEETPQNKQALELESLTEVAR